MKPTEDPMAPTMKRIQDLVKAAGLALEDGVSHAAGYANHEEFRRSLIAGLDGHPGFVDAVRVFHGQAAAPPKGAKGQTPRAMVQAGRVQAPRHDSPRGARAKQR
ncbi:MAG TPA: hypothetical protein VK842_00515 [bacterium]|jgi:hypothetical protein|nr:hypothetical protein [bacterium]